MMKLDGISVDGRSATQDNVTIIGFKGSFFLDEEKTDDFSFSQTIFNDKLYSENIEQCNREFELFRNKVKEIAKKVR